MTRDEGKDPGVLDTSASVVASEAVNAEVIKRDRVMFWLGILGFAAQLVVLIFFAGILYAQVEGNTEDILRNARGLEKLEREIDQQEQRVRTFYSESWPKVIAAMERLPGILTRIERLEERLR